MLFVTLSANVMTILPFKAWLITLMRVNKKGADDQQEKRHDGSVASRESEIFNRTVKLAYGQSLEGLLSTDSRAIPDARNMPET